MDSRTEMTRDDTEKTETTTMGGRRQSRRQSRKQGRTGRRQQSHKGGKSRRQGRTGRKQ